MEWSSFIVGMGGLIVGAFSIYLSFKSRTSSFQQRLHSKQLDTIVETFEMIKFPFFASTLIAIFDSKEKEKDLESYLESFQKSFNKLFDEFISGPKNDIVLPQALYKLRKNMISDLVEIITNRKRLNKSEKFNLVDKISKDRIEFISQSRKLLGIDELSDLNIKMFNKEQDLKSVLTRIGVESTDILIKAIINYA